MAMPNKNVYHHSILYIIAIIIILLFVLILLNKPRLELFKNEDIISEINLFDNSNYEKNRTLLYGSLFLDNLNRQIKNMTDPNIKYDTKRIDIIKYADILL
jgi:hypothetical protein